MTGAAEHWLLESVQRAVADQPCRWRVIPATDAVRPWILGEPIDQALPAQGWKLHVSSFGAHAAETLRRVLPVVVARRVAFKALGSVAWLGQINRGSAGLSQIGKFITVYPRSDDEVVEIALALTAATCGLRGPEIPSDHAIRVGGLQGDGGSASVVAYRYGAFGDSQMQTRLGEVLPSLTDADGRLVPDRRGSAPNDPSWVVDPFAARGLRAESRRATTVAGRYRPVLTLSHAPGVLVQLALDVAEPRTCVIKRARLRGDDAAPNDDPAVRLRREGTLLASMGATGATPRLYEVVDTGEELTVVTEDLGTETLERYVGGLASCGQRPSLEVVVEFGVALAEAVAALHDRGFIHGDLKSSNILVTPDRRLRLIDLDLAQPIASDARPTGAGTRGYTSAGCRAGATAIPSDDIFAIGAVLYLLATGAEPSRAPDAEHLFLRAPALLNLAVSASLLRVVARCLADDPAHAFTSTRELRSALLACLAEADDATAENADVRHPPTAERGPLTRPRRMSDRDPLDAPTPSAIAPEALLRHARRAADRLCSQAEPANGGFTWRSTYYRGKGLLCRDISAGMAGTILALAELVDEFGSPAHIDVLRGGANALARFDPLPGDRPAGLYIGDAGVTAALLRAGQVLDNADLIGIAVERALADVRRPIDSPDLFHGSAGRILVDLLLWDETGQSELLAHAIHLGEDLLQRREGDPGVARWRIPAGYSDLSGQCYFGYAHGAAGIADVLLDLHEATGERRFADAALDATTWILGHAVPVLGGRGLGWPQVEGGIPHPPFWCHGATGIGRLLLHATKLDLLDGTEILMRVSRAVADGATWSGPTLCHGLAGNAELLIDIARCTRDRRILGAADRLFAIVEAFRVESDDGCGWIAEAPRQITPDYLVGYGGIALAHLRRGRLDRPMQLSRAGFRYRTAATASR